MKIGSWKAEYSLHTSGFWEALVFLEKVQGQDLNIATHFQKLLERLIIFAGKDLKNFMFDI